MDIYYLDVTNRSLICIINIFAAREYSKNATDELCDLKKMIDLYNNIN